jgi:hypothetical protein
MVGFGQCVEAPQHVGQRARIAQVLFARIAGGALHPVEVGAGAETFSRG